MRGTFFLALAVSAAAVQPAARPTRASAMPRRALLSLPVLALPGAAFAAATGGGFTMDQMVSAGGGMPKELRVTGENPKAKCSKCVPTDAELQRLTLGYKRLAYLLDNWEKETTVCIRGCVGPAENCGCVRDPVVVQGYMGYKSMNDPLFKIDQLMLRAQPLVSDDNFDRYTAAIDRWVEKADDGNVMAYVSSWGEANPGGGKDEVDRYLAKSRKGVVESSEILKTIIDILGVPM